MINQANFHIASSTEDNFHTLTMSEISARLHMMHKKMQQKETPFLPEEPPLPFVEDNSDKLLHERLDEISHAIIADYQDRRKREDVILSNIASILAKSAALDAAMKKTAAAPSATDRRVTPISIDAICARLEERFFKHQQEALLSISNQIDRLSRDLHEAIAAKNNPVQLEEIEQKIRRINLQVNDTAERRPRDWQEALSTILKNIPVQVEAEAENKQTKPFDADASMRLINSARKARQPD